MPAAKDQQSHINKRIQKIFGTNDWAEILGPAGTNPPTQSIAARFKELGIQPTNVSRIKKLIPADLYQLLEPYQKALSVEKQLKAMNEKYGGNAPACSQTVRDKMAATNLERYGGVSPLSDPAIMAKLKATNLGRYGVVCSLLNPKVNAKRQATYQAKFGGNPSSLTPEEIVYRLNLQELEPLEPIVHNSDRHKEINVRCKLCGRKFTTHLVSIFNLTHKQGYKCCECQRHSAKLELFGLDYVRAHYCPDAYQWSCIPWMNGQEIDIFLPNKNIGFEINGFASHNSTQGYKGVGDPKGTDFHHFKSAACLSNGIKLYHFWYDTDTLSNRERLISFIDGILQYQYCKPSPGDKVDRDAYPDPTEAGLPYTELPPEPFDSPDGICYNSGYWLFLEPNKE